MSAIEWTERTWNPVTGCDRVSPGCAHCYALDLAARLKGMGQPKYQRDGDPKTSGPGFGVTLHPETLEEPLRRRKPTMYFVNSMSDLFHEEVPYEFISEVLHVMVECERHTFQVLTKRPERIFDFFESELAHEGFFGFPDNVWVGVSIENRRFVQRAEMLRDVPAKVRFISAEPLLGPLVNELGFPERSGRAWRWEDGYVGPSLDLAGTDWLIVGGESGAGHRPVDVEWVRELRNAATTECCGVCDGKGERAYAGPARECWRCHGSGRQTAFFFKQWGGRTPKAGGRELDGRTWDEMPARAKALA